MTTKPNRVFAVDWSGAKTGYRRKIWVAEANAEGLRSLRDGWSRDEVVGFLVEEAQRDPRLVVGLDFSFSFPDWFVDELGCSNASELWKLAAVHGDTWLDPAGGSPYFYRRGRWNHEGKSPLRRTEEHLRTLGKTPETVFKLVGPTQVGPGAVRGMPCLAALEAAGFHVWPFHAPELPCAVEIYPALFYPRGTKSHADKRRAFVEGDPRLTPQQRDDATRSDDAFDAVVAALALWDRWDSSKLTDLDYLGVADPTATVEGWIWS